MPRVTVVVPTYDRADVLPRAIDSVLAQTFADLELLVVDDGSTDETQELLSTYSDPRVRTVVHDTNRGANAARNTGIESARGEYVALLDSDDEWRQTKLERQFERLDRESDEWIGVYCDTVVRTPGTTGAIQTLAASVLARSDGTRRTEGGEELAGEILADNVHPGAGSTLVVRTDVARAVGGFDETLDRFQDPEFVLRILEEGRVAYVDEPLVVRHETGAPDAETVEEADEQYLATHASTVAKFERRGYDIRGSHDLVLAKHYFEDSRFLRGARYLSRATTRPRHYPGVCWAIGAGLRKKDRTAIFLVGVVLALVIVLARFDLVARSGELRAR